MKKLILVSAAITISAFSQAKTIEMPADSVVWRKSDLPGYQLVIQKCTTCHSAHYAEYQPPNTGVGYWNTQVLRMKNVFKAPITDEEVPIIVQYLNQTYGANRKQEIDQTKKPLLIERLFLKIFTSYYKESVRLKSAGSYQLQDHWRTQGQHLTTARTLESLLYGLVQVVERK